MNVCGPQIARRRSELGWSQPQLALKCQLQGWDVSRDIIARIEGGVRCVEDIELATLARVLDLRLDALYPEEIRAMLPK
ncbi:MAG: hypothetical protein BGO12_02765 [Verrucomicrobia bacterium 61-8]|nr:helix-turn-helix transcriptional regulator [Verrucomicrobiota bacterium]OJU98329.1 MAG: hypothetical protein BGO12_02765 [Verrucomicrobia bacterium 61-8]